MSGYKDADGNPCTLDTLCKRDPEWAASRHRAMLATIEALRADLDGGGEVPR